MKIKKSLDMLALMGLAEQMVEELGNKAIPPEGLMHPLLNFSTDEIHYQVDIVHDHRYKEKCFIGVYRFDTMTLAAVSANYILTKELDCKNSHRKKKTKKVNCPKCGGPPNKNGWVHKKNLNGSSSCPWSGARRHKY